MWWQVKVDDSPLYAGHARRVKWMIAYCLMGVLGGLKWMIAHSDGCARRFKWMIAHCLMGVVAGLSG